MQNEETTGVSKKHRVGRIVWTVILIAVLMIGSAAAYIFREEIAIAYFALTTPKEAVESQKAENDKKTNDLLNELTPEITMRDLTDEERAMLANGELSYEEALALIRGETLAPATTAVPIETTAAPEPARPAETAAPEETTAATVATAETTVATSAATTAATTTETEPPVTTADAEAIAAANRRKEEIIAEIYLLRAMYLNEIDGLVDAAIETYVKGGEWTLTKKMTILQDMMPAATQLEKECDGKMDALLAELSELLLSLGQGTDLIEQIRGVYREQKTLKIAELYDKYIY